MIKILKKCEDIAYLLENLKPVVKDFRVCLRKNENLYVNVVLTEDRYDELSVAVHQIYNEAELECLTEEQLEDPFYKSIFAQKGPVILDSGHRRNGSLKIRKPQSDTTERPVVVSFYSYKGGMGRTTAMAAFAMYLSSVYAKRVAVIDCDYEAPGLNNFFLKYPGELNNHNGLVEYLLDMSCGLLDTNTVTDYLQEVDHVFSGEGSIFVMTAGNMGVDRITSESSDTHLDHYLEGISRMDISNTRYAVELFEALVGDINNALHPDIILIDSKTGINDVMGLAVCSLADIVVGFFRNDAQTLPGLQFFIKTMMDNSRVEPFLVNSILPSARSQRRTLFGQFTKDVDSIINAVDNDSNICFPCYPIGRQPDFEVLGSVAETVNDFAEAVRNGDFREYVELFEDLIKSIRKHGEILSDDNSQTKDALRESILLDTSETLSGIDLYAENQSILNDISNRHFYYRRCMNDLLNHD